MTAGKPSSAFTAMAIGVAATCAFFLIFYFLVNPSYVYTAQQPVFFTTWGFFLDTARYPGGLATYLGLLASQCYYYPWLGAAISALLMGAVYVGTLIFLLMLTGVFRPMGALIPFILLLLMHCSFFHLIEFDFQILFLCACGIASLSGRRMKGVSGMPAELAFLLVVYAFAGIAISITYLIMLFCIRLYEGAGVKELIALLIPVAMGIVAIGIACYTSVIPNPFNEVASAITSTHYAISFLPGIVLLYYALAPLGSSLVQKNRPATRFLRGRLPALCGYVTVMGLGLAGAFFSFDPAIQRCLRFDHFAQEHEWKFMLDEERSLAAYTTYDLYFLYRSLYHENMLLIEVAANSAFGIASAMIFDIEKMPCLFSAIFNSDLFFDMGATNQAIRWAFEAINNYRCLSPRLLQRLTLCYAAQGKIEMARSLLGVLDNTIIGRHWARTFAPVLNDSLRLAADGEIRRLRMLEPVKAYISSTDIPSYEFRHIWLHSRTFNNMAFEYSLALIPELMSEHIHFSGFVAECQAGNARSCREMENSFANTRMMYDYLNAQGSRAHGR